MTTYSHFISYPCQLVINPPKVIGTNSIGQFTLMGVSAGAFGVAFNCDAVAATVKAKDPNAGDRIGVFFSHNLFRHPLPVFSVTTLNLNSDVRCIMDSHDFIPTTVSEGCDPLG